MDKETVADLRTLGFQIEHAGQALLTITTRMPEAAIYVDKVPEAVRLATDGLKLIRQAVKIVVIPLED